MRRHGKKYRAAFEKIEAGRKYTLQESIEKVKEVAFAKFDETVELHLRLEQGEQVVRRVGLAEEAAELFKAVS